MRTSHGGGEVLGPPPQRGARGRRKMPAAGVDLVRHRGWGPPSLGSNPRRPALELRRPVLDLCHPPLSRVGGGVGSGRRVSGRGVAAPLRVGEGQGRTAVGRLRRSSGRRTTVGNDQ